MKLVKFIYSQFKNHPDEWVINDFTLGDINLIVGSNATGKTRTLNVIRGLADLVSEVETLQWQDGKYDAEFVNSVEVMKYHLEYHNGSVESEQLTIGSQIYLTRGEKGIGKIFAQQLNTEIQFQSPTNRVAVFSKRDEIQHPFLEKLYSWGKGLLRYDFGTTMGRDILALQPSNDANVVSDVSPRDTQKVVEFFQRGQKKFGDEFVQAVIQDMAQIGYELTQIGVAIPSGVQVKSTIGNLDVNPISLFIQEKGIQDRIYQTNISQGMFRAISILTQLNYAFFASEPSCILIDDIGEGLDFRRSSLLIKLLIEKVKRTSAQLVMTTNDRFVMNSVPLEYWILLERKGSEIVNYNYRNSKQMFDDFELTGLNNFDFFSTNYYKR